MKQHRSWYLPDYETHFVEWMINNNEHTYQRQQREHALKHVKKFRTAIDVGGNIGFWSKDFCQKFENVVIFEPNISNIECLKKNLEMFTNYKIYTHGLGNMNGKKTFYNSLNTSGGHSLHRDEIRDDKIIETIIDIKKLDDYNLINVDLIKIDTQGSELDVLKGATQTIMKNNCVINLEMSNKTKNQMNKNKKIVELLDELDYVEIGGYSRTKKDKVFIKKGNK